MSRFRRSPSVDRLHKKVERMAPILQPLAEKSGIDKTLESGTMLNHIHWLTYWLCYWIFHTLEPVLDTVLVWVPYYHLAKPLFLLSLFSPIFPPSSLSDSATKLSSAAKEGDGDRTHRSNGAEDGQRRRGCAVVYANLLQPFLSSHESFLDESLDRAQRSLKLVGSEVTGVGSELITNVASNVATSIHRQSITAAITAITTVSKLASRPATPTRPQRMLSDGENVAGDGEDVTDADAGVDAAAAADDDGMNRANID